MLLLRTAKLGLGFLSCDDFPIFRSSQQDRGMVAMSFLFLVTVCFMSMHGYSFATDSTPTTAMEGPPPGCSTLMTTNSQNLTGYFGWPLVVSFGNVALDVFNDFFYNGQEDSIKLSDLENRTALCIVRLASTGEVHYNFSFIFHENTYFNDAQDAVYRFSNISEDTPTAYNLEFKFVDRCRRQKVFIQKENAPEVDSKCNNALHSRLFKGVNGNLYELPCSEGKRLDFLSGTTNLTYKWIYNCGKEVDQSFQRRGNLLVLENINFSMAGQYLCVIEYRGLRIPRIKLDVCVQHKNIQYPSVELHCNVPNAVLGDNVTISCKADVGETKVNEMFTSVVWKKGGNQICKEPSWKRLASAGKYICSKESSLDDVPCYSTQPVPKVQVDSYTVNLTILNVNVSDLGEYQLEFKWAPGMRTRKNIILKQDVTVVLKHWTAGVSVGMSILLLAILFLLLCLLRKNDVRWFIKKRFGPYEKEPHSYAAYFVYYYDSTDKASDEMTTMKNLVEGLHEFMNKFGGTVYDEQRDPNVVAGDAENVKFIVGDCHRIIVMLSPGFVRDQWSRYKTNTALTEAVETEKKIIFITIPGTKDAIQNLDDESRKTLQSALKRNITARWNGKIPFNGSFRRRMEYGLPKLQKPDYSRYLSDSSELQLTYKQVRLDRTGLGLEFNQVVEEKLNTILQCPLKTPGRILKAG